MYLLFSWDESHPTNLNSTIVEVKGTTRRNDKINFRFCSRVHLMARHGSVHYPLEHTEVDKST